MRARTQVFGWCVLVNQLWRPPGPPSEREKVRLTRQTDSCASSLACSLFALTSCARTGVCHVTVARVRSLQTRAAAPLIRPTIPARFLVAACPLPSPQHRSPPLGAFLGHQAFPTRHTLVTCPWRGVGPPQIAAPNPHIPCTRPRRLVTAGASPHCMAVFSSFRRYNPTRRHDGGNDAMTPPLSLPLAAGAATSGVVSRARVAVTPSGGGCGGDHSGASCDDDDGGEARGGRARHCRRRRRHRRRPCRSPVAKD